MNAKASAIATFANDLRRLVAGMTDVADVSGILPDDPLGRFLITLKDRTVIRVTVTAGDVAIVPAVVPRQEGPRKGPKQGAGPKPTSAAPEPHEILTTTELSEWFKVSARTVERWKIPSVAPGRYLFQHVLDWCAEQKRPKGAGSSETP